MQIDSEVAQVERAATAAWQTARFVPGAGGIVDEIWTEFRGRAQAAKTLPERLANARQAANVMGELAVLGADFFLEASGRSGARPGISVGETMELAWDRVGGAIADFRADKHKRNAIRAEELRQGRELKAAADEAEAPQRLLASLRVRGFAPELTSDGKHVAVLPDQFARLLPSDVDALKHRKAGVIAVLKAEIEAARPVVIA